LASLAVLPYARSLHPKVFARIPVAIEIFVFAQFVQAFVLLGLLTWCGLRLASAVGLASPIAAAVLYRRAPFAWPSESLGLAVLAGSLTGAGLRVLDRAFAPYMPVATHEVLPDIAVWKRFLASFYGGITEELICRLFLMTLIVWLCHQCAPRGAKLQTLRHMHWIGILGAALAFGLGHLSMAAAVWPLTPIVVARVIVLNAIGGTVFGWLYSRCGLEHAMVAHFCADVVLHVGGWP
jgi:hypothetical protein